MLAEDTRKLGLVIAAAIALTACGRTRLGIVGKDSGTTASDVQLASDVFSNDGPSQKDAAGDAVTADAGPDIPFSRDSANPDTAILNQDVGPDVPVLGRDSASPDTSGIEKDAGPDLPDLGRDGTNPDTTVIDKDASPDGSMVRRETATDGVSPDAAAEGGGPLPCPGTFMLGGFLPLGKTGGTPGSVALGDLDGDGRLDLVTANARPATVSVLLGNGDGSFATKTDYAVGFPNSVGPPEFSPSALALGDINGDGKLDIAVVQDSPDGYNAGGLVIVLLAKGDGTFPSTVSYSADMGPSSVALGDVNGDGKLDVVSANYDSDDVMATFGTSGEHGAWCPTGHGPRTVVLGDLNADGKLDYVTVNMLASSVSVLLGSGDGTCAARTDIPIGRDLSSPSSSAALGDVNGDGKLDLVVATSSPGTVSVLLGQGDGNLAAPVDYPAGDGPVLVALRDLNGDRKLDILVAASASGTVGVLLGQGDGTFAAKVDYPGVRSLRSAALGDLNSDGNLDLVMAGPITDYSDVGWTSVLFGTGPGTFVSRPVYPTGVDLSAMALADLNGDGKLDVAAVGSKGDSTGTATVLLGAGGGIFGAKADFTAGDHPSSFALADVNDDGKLDIVTTNQKAATVSVLLGAGDGTFAANVDYATAESPSSVALADLDGDGKLDIATVGFGYSPPGSRYRVLASVLRGMGGGNFAAHEDYALNGGSALTPQSLALGDLRGDGTVDIVVAPDTSDTAEPGCVDTMLGRGDGTFEDNNGCSLYVPPVNSVVLVDLNGDSSLDIVAAATRSSGADGRGRVAVSLGRGDGTFNIDWSKSSLTGYGARSLALGDLNHDGKLDIITGNLDLSRTDTPGTVSVLFGNGDGTFAPGLDYPAGALSLALGDVNGDGRLEIVTATPSKSIEVLFSACR